MRNFKVIVLFIAITCLASCNKELVNDIERNSLSEDNNITILDIPTSNDTNGFEILEPLDSIRFKITNGYGFNMLSYDEDNVSPETNYDGLKNYKFVIDGEEFYTYGEEFAIVGNRIINTFINNLIILSYDGADNVIGRIEYEKVYILDAEGKTDLLNIDEEIYNAEILYIINGDNLSNINFVENIKKLRCLYFEDAEKISSISPISDLHYMEILKLENSKKLRDLLPIEKLENLRELDVEISNMPDEEMTQNLEILSKMTKLEKLSIKNFQLINLSFLKDLINLRELSINKNSQDADYSIPHELSALEILEINLSESFEVDINDFNNIKKLIVQNANLSKVKFNVNNSLAYLEIVNCDNLNLDEQANLENIHTLIVSSTSVESLWSVIGDNLENLYLKHVITDYQQLSKFTQLKNLSILGDYQNCSNLEFIGEMKNLYTLTIYATYIEDLKPIEKLANLKKLSIYYLNSTCDFSHLENLNELYIYSVYNQEGDEHIDISSIGQLMNLKILDLVEVEQNNYEFIEQLGNLENLRLICCLIDKFPNLSELTDLEKIVIGENDVYINTENISNIPNLKNLVIYQTDLDGLENIGEIETLEVLVLTNVNDMDVTPLRELSKLKYFFSKNTKLLNIDEIRNNTIFDVEILN